MVQGSKRVASSEIRMVAGKGRMASESQRMKGTGWGVFRGICSDLAGCGSHGGA